MDITAVLQLTQFPKSGFALLLAYLELFPLFPLAINSVPQVRFRLGLGSIEIGFFTLQLTQFPKSGFASLEFAIASLRYRLGLQLTQFPKSGFAGEHIPS